MEHSFDSAILNKTTTGKARVAGLIVGNVLQPEPSLELRRDQSKALEQRAECSRA